MGVAVFSGMIGVTIFGLFLTPVFYVVIMSLRERSSPNQHSKNDAATPATEETSPPTPTTA